MKPYIFMGLFVIVLVAVVFFIQNTGPQCKADSECVASICCHATQCIPASAAPNCSDVMCTEECVANTLDCGQASCACIKGMCRTAKT